MANDIDRAQFLPGGDYAVLAIHGLRSTPLELQPLLKSLHKSGFTVDAPHLSDYGFSSLPCNGTWRDWLAEALARFDTLSAQYAIDRNVSLFWLVIPEGGYAVFSQMPADQTQVRWPEPTAVVMSRH